MSADSETDTGFSVNADEYIAQIAAAEARGEAPVGMTAGLLHALRVANERESSSKDRERAESWIDQGGGKEWYVAAFRCMECDRLPTEHESVGDVYVCTDDSSRWVTNRVSQPVSGGGVG